MTFKIIINYWDKSECTKAILLKKLLMKDYLIHEEEIEIKRSSDKL